MSQPLPAVRYVVPLVAAALLAGCSAINLDNNTTRVGSPPYEKGSGTVATAARELTAFHAVSASQGVTVLVSSGSTAGAKVRGDDNLLDNVTTTVANGTLRVEIRGSIETRNRLEVTVTAGGPVDGLAADSGSTVDAEGLEAGELSVSASSGATVRGGGHAQSLRVTATAGSTADLRNIEAGGVHVDASSGSTIHVNASGAVAGTCTAGSTVKVGGKPASVDVSADTSSSVGRE